MVRLRKLLDQGSEVTFLPGDGAADDGTRTYDVRVVTADGTELAAAGPSPQGALLNVTRLEGSGRRVTFAPDPVGGWFCDLRDAGGRCVQTGLGRSHAQALAHLRERLQRDGLDLAGEAEPAPALPWMRSQDGTRWSAVLADGRTGVIERLDDGASFLPKVHESSTEFATGPACGSFLAAAGWAAEFAAGAGR